MCPTRISAVVIKDEVYCQLQVLGFTLLSMRGKSRLFRKASMLLLRIIKGWVIPLLVLWWIYLSFAS